MMVDDEMDSAPMQTPQLAFGRKPSFHTTQGAAIQNAFVSAGHDMLVSPTGKHGNMNNAQRMMAQTQR